MASPEMMNTQVAVIGAGPGGYVAAIRLAQLGKQVTLIEKDHLGGVCLNWGCIPSKAMIHAASLYEKMAQASSMGIMVEGITVDPERLQMWKNQVVKKLTGGVAQLMKAHNITVLKGFAAFEDPHTLTVSMNEGGEKRVVAEQILIATGSVPIEIPGFELDGERVIDSQHALSLMKIPKSMAIIGGGVIGLEIGTLYQKLGTKITVVERLPQLLAGTDHDVIDTLKRTLKKRNIDVLLDTEARGYSVKNELCELSLDTPNGASMLEVEKIMVAVGRKPHLEALAIEKSGVVLDDRNFVMVNEQMRTSVEHIFAIGDVTSAPLLAHKASKEGQVAAGVMAGGPDVVDYRAMPAAVFSDPEIATVGLTQADAEAKNMNIRVGKFPFQASGRALSLNDAEGFVKIIADADTDQVLGVHMIGPDVSEILGEATLAIELGACAQDLALTVHTHPTLTEALMEASESIHDKAIHIFQPRRKGRSTSGV